MTRPGIIFVLVLITLVMTAALAGQTTALPEYAVRTGEPCGACHVNPAGSGPRSQRGLLWVAAGKPAKVPDLPGKPGAVPGQTSGFDLYKQQGCNGCHGNNGEGLVGPALTKSDLDLAAAREIIRKGKGAMPAYAADKLPDADLDAMIAAFKDLASVPSAEAPSALPPGKLTCGGGTELAVGGVIPSCGGN
ncbi:MAG: hypothetical protein A2Z04_01900 [Chloroflexi bacterium RBG_16_57_9]|nr:MAG: hypothetical protein A2Z04_01900 [Chloroflexi bacterium RBG_16_57_9]